MTPDNATLRQIVAADPTVSTWLSANAGSGKTRVLTDRVARLLLDGVSPQNILCLTYTKAAASEMQNRLFRRLGKWSLMPDDLLRQELAVLGAPALEDGEKLTFARTLFARAIDTPGGLRIQTIHSFCASLLRRFPLEAGVSPVFHEIDERAAKILRDEVIQDMARGRQAGLVRDLAIHYSGEDFSALAAEAIRHRAAIATVKSRSEIWARFGLPADFDSTALLSNVFLGDEQRLISALLPILKGSDKVTDHKSADKLAAVSFTDPTRADLSLLFPLFLFGAKAKAPYGAKTDGFPTKAARDAAPELVPELNDLMRRVEAARDMFAGLLAAEKTVAFTEFSEEFLPQYDARKASRGWLDFDDLITRARALLSDPAVAQWVLYRLDGGLDHILVDEAQDTSPDQWDVIRLLAQEFSVGMGARPGVRRTIFVVGDLKQSIYSFQGADPRAFDRMRQHFSSNLANAQ
ncbi:MAG: UvrD-helicase domain-containing protein, partial [Paracoccaceae bacterium]